MTGQMVGIVVPTLGTRPEFLLQCLTSIRNAGNAYILLVAPEKADLSEVETQGLVDGRLTDPGSGLAAAIDFGLTSLPESIEFINWLGDDDKLTSGSLRISTEALQGNPKAPYAFGGCNYIDETGRVLWTNRSGRWAKYLMRVGPDLIPQPGALMRRKSFEAIGGLDTSFGWAFDLDMFLRLEKLGKGVFLNHVLAEFRWHEGSLSVGARSGSAKESRAIRTAQLPRYIRCVAPIWEVPFGLAGHLAAKKLSRSATNKSS